MEPNNFKSLSESARKVLNESAEGPLPFPFEKLPYGPGNKYRYDPIRRQSVPINPEPNDGGLGEAPCETQECWDNYLQDLQDLVDQACGQGSSPQCEWAKGILSRARRLYKIWKKHGTLKDDPGGNVVESNISYEPSDAEKLRNLTEAVNNLYQQGSIKPLTEQEKKDLLIESMLLLEGNKDYEAEYQDLVEAIRRCYEGVGGCKGLEGWLKRLKELEELCPNCDFPPIPKDERKTGDEIIQQGLPPANMTTQRPPLGPNGMFNRRS